MTSCFHNMPYVPSPSAVHVRYKRTRGRSLLSPIASCTITAAVLIGCTVFIYGEQVLIKMLVNFQKNYSVGKFWCFPSALQTNRMFRTYLLLPQQRWRCIVMNTSVCAFVCVSVCLSASISPEAHARSLPNFSCTFPTAVPRSSSGWVTKYQGAILGFLSHWLCTA